jgi:predicted permease
VNRVLTRLLADLPDQQVRAGVRNLNSLGGSICLDLLDEDGIERLMLPDSIQTPGRT